MALSNPPLDSQHTKGRFTNKVSIITGGASGIGRATVLRFVNDGAAVAVFDINEAAGKQLQDELTAAGHNVKFYKVDVAHKEQCVEGVKKVAEEHEGKIHFLVNNAGVGAPCKGLDSSKEDWDKVLGINVIGYSNMVQACYPFMAKAEAWDCSVVNISSVQAHRTMPFHSGWTYQASKGAVTAMTKCMALDLSANGIRVNSVSPGYTWTEQVQGVLGERKNCEATVAKRQMSRRFGEPAETAAAIAFLCSKDASYITGTELAVDGGYLALGPEALGE
ncbi:hypothetical protein OS493_026795 [Desmophyllum pertusum]|uniref:Uncharacterized protein n=1 Tax=Desmophyllum pertusum TaxID=174260 RepID=A0A9X0D1P0_9CNID|nr:hypothetical protein OS493_026795 [Desmophyllum pertusum]